MNGVDPENLDNFMIKLSYVSGLCTGLYTAAEAEQPAMKGILSEVPTNQGNLLGPCQYSEAEGLDLHLPNHLDVLHQPSEVL